VRSWGEAFEELKGKKVKSAGQIVGRSWRLRKRGKGGGKVGSLYKSSFIKGRRRVQRGGEGGSRGLPPENPGKKIGRLTDCLILEDKRSDKKKEEKKKKKNPSTILGKPHWRKKPGKGWGEGGEREDFHHLTYLRGGIPGEKVGDEKRKNRLLFFLKVGNEDIGVTVKTRPKKGKSKQVSLPIWKAVLGMGRLLGGKKGMHSHIFSLGGEKKSVSTFYFIARDGGCLNSGAVKGKGRRKVGEGRVIPRIPFCFRRRGG